MINKHMKKYLASVVSGERQIKWMINHYLTSNTKAAIK